MPQALTHPYSVRRARRFLKLTSMALSVETVFVEVLVVTTMALTGALTGSIYIGAKRWLRQQQAWQWWHEQQVSCLHDQAETIRDGLLQQTFAFRRYLEGADSDRNPEEAQAWLDRFQTFHQSLERLSNHLSPPFLADSLPLALQFVLKEWQQTQGIKTELTGGSGWTQEQPSEVNRAVLSVLARLLQLLQEGKQEGDQRRLRVEMHQEAAQCRIEIQFEGDATAVAERATAPEMRHLQEIFYALVAGRLTMEATGNSLVGQLQWPARQS